MVHAKDCDTYNFLGQCKFIDDAAEVTQVLLEFLSHNMDRGEFCIIHLSNKLALSYSFQEAYHAQLQDTCSSQWQLIATFFNGRPSMP